MNIFNNDDSLKFKNNLENISKNFFQFLNVKENDKIEKIGLFKIILENLHEISGTINKKGVEYILIKSIEEADPQWMQFDPSLLKLINHAAVNLGLKQGVLKSEREHAELNEVIKQIHKSTQKNRFSIFESLPSSKTLYYSEEFRKKHQKTIDEAINILKLNLKEKDKPGSQEKSEILDEQLDASLIKINESLAAEMHGISLIALQGLKDAVKKMEELISLAANEKTGNKISNTVIATAMACCDWTDDFNNFYDTVAKTAAKLWSDATKQQGDTPHEKFSSLKEAGDLLISLNKVLKSLQQALPGLKETVISCKKKLAGFETKDEQIRVTPFIPDVEHHKRPDDFNPVVSTTLGPNPFTLMQHHLALLENGFKAVDKTLPGRLQVLEKQLAEQNILETIEQHQQKAGIENFEEKVDFLLKEYDEIDSSDVKKLDAYIALRRELDVFLSLPLPKEAASKISGFCQKEEDRLNLEAGDAIPFDELVQAAIVKDGLPKSGLLGRWISALNPENWSDTTKQLVHTVLVAAQISEQAIHGYQKTLLQPRLTAHKAQEIIEEARVLGTILTQQNTDPIDPKVYQALKPTIQAAKDRYGDAMPSGKELQALLTNYCNYRAQCLLHPQEAKEPQEWMKGQEGVVQSGSPDFIWEAVYWEPMPMAAEGKGQEGSNVYGAGNKIVSAVSSLFKWIGTPFFRSRAPSPEEMSLIPSEPLAVGEKKESTVEDALITQASYSQPSDVSTPDDVTERKESTVEDTLITQGSYSQPSDVSTPDDVTEGKESTVEDTLITQGSYSQPSAISMPKNVAEKKETKSLADKILLHQLGDFFGKNTGLEGFSRHIDGFKFYRNLLSGLVEKGEKSETVQAMVNKLDQAIHLSEFLSRIIIKRTRQGA